MSNEFQSPRQFANYLREQLKCGRIDFSDIIVRPDGIGQIRFDIHNLDGIKTHEVFLEHTGKYKLVKLPL